ncbi:hypothetical protein BGZ94_006388, partial [Podila epigama]
MSYVCQHGETLDIDIIGVQETWVPSSKSRFLLQRADDYLGVWSNSETHVIGKGVGMLIRRRWNTYRLETDTDQDHRGVFVSFGFHSGFRLAVLCCYFPPRTNQEASIIKGRLTHWAQRHIQTCRANGFHIVLLGDFNAVVEPSIDRANNAHKNPESALFTWLSSHTFVDAYRMLHANGGFTCRDVS